MSNTEHVIPALASGSKENQEPSCLNCEFSRNMGTALWCEKLNQPLTNTSIPSDLAKESYRLTASTCSTYQVETSTGSPWLAQPPRASSVYSTNMEAFFPVVSVDPTRLPARVKSRVTSCQGCRWFNEGGGTQLGFRVPGSVMHACSATGKILGPGGGNLESISRACDLKEPRDLVGQEITNLELKISARMFPVFSEEHLLKFKEKREAESASSTTGTTPFLPDHDPATYEGLPVDESLEEIGIRTWYEVPDPEGTGNSVMIPIFRRSFFPESEQEKIPSRRDDERPQDFVDHQGLIYRILVAWHELDETPALIGPPGTGKSEILRTISWMMQLPFERISITESTELDDLQGKMLFQNNETRFQYGRLAAAWSKPNVICLDEPNVGPRDVWQFIRPLTDNSKQLVLDANKGERIIRDTSCFIGLAMNPAWDSRNSGAEVLADADSSRLLHIETELPDWETESRIIKERVARDNWEFPAALLEMMKGITEDIRSMVDSHEIPISWGIRSQIKVARLLRWFPVVRAYEMAGMSSLEPGSREAVISMIKTRLPSGAS